MYIKFIYSQLINPSSITIMIFARSVAVSSVQYPYSIQYLLHLLHSQNISGENSALHRLILFSPLSTEQLITTAGCYCCSNEY